MLAKKYADKVYGLGCIFKIGVLSYLMDNIDKLVVLLNDYNDP